MMSHNLHFFIIIHCMFSQMFIDHLVFFLNYVPDFHRSVSVVVCLLLFIVLHMLRMLIFYLSYLLQIFSQLFAFRYRSIFEMLNFKFIGLLHFCFYAEEPLFYSKIWKINLALKFSSRFFMAFFLTLNF